MILPTSGSLIFQNTRRIMSFFPNKDRFNHAQKSKIVYKASCRDWHAFYIGKAKRRLHDRKTEHFKALSHLVTPPLLLIIELLPDTTSNGAISRSLQEVNVIYKVKSRKHR